MFLTFFFLEKERGPLCFVFYESCVPSPIYETLGVWLCFGI